MPQENAEKPPRVIFIPNKTKKGWFLHYGKGHNTGGFSTKKDAQAWYDNGGR